MNLSNVVQRSSTPPLPSPQRSLQDWYYLVNKIYFDRNHKRSLEEIYVHFIEVSKPLCLAGTKGRKKDTDPKTHLAKSLGWFFALCGRAGIPDVEEMIWRKFPRHCPYCKLQVHDSAKCKERDPSKSEVDWLELRRIGKEEPRPETLAAWQRMYQKTYPRSENTDHSLNVRRLHEEIGELSEAIRVIEIAPQYFVSEAPDVFSWLMGFANQFDFDAEPSIPNEDFGLALEQLLHEEYPGVCRFCRREICGCPKILDETLGRIAKEAPEAVFDRKKGLFTLKEATAFFATAALRVGGTDVSFTETEKHKLLGDMSTVLEKLKVTENVNPQILIGIAHISTSLEQLARSGALSQARLDEIIVEIRNMPSDAKNVFLNLIASGIYGAVAMNLRTHLGVQL